MPSVSIRELSRNPSKVVAEVAATGRPALVTRHGRAVVALVPIDEDELEDFVLSYAPEFIRSRKEADEDLRRGRTREAFGFFDELEAEARIDGPSRAGRKSAPRSPAAADKRKKPRPARPRTARRSG